MGRSYIVPRGTRDEGEEGATIEVPSGLRIRCLYHDPVEDTRDPVVDMYVVMFYQTGEQVLAELCRTDSLGDLQLMMLERGRVASIPQGPFEVGDDTRIRFAEGPDVRPGNYLLTGEGNLNSATFYLWPRPDFSDMDFTVSVSAARRLSVGTIDDPPNHVLLDASWPIWVERVRDKTQELYDAMLGPMTRMDRLSAIQAIWHQARRMVEDRGLTRVAASGTGAAAGSQADQHAYTGVILRVLDHMVSFTTEQFVEKNRELEAAMRRPAQELWNILQAEIMNRAYLAWFGGDGQRGFEEIQHGGETFHQLDEDTRDIFRDAYVILSKTAHVGSVYDTHLQPQVANRFSQTVSTAKWVVRTTDKLADIYAAFMLRGNRSAIFRNADDLLAVADHMEELGYMQNTSELRPFMQQVRTQPELRFNRAQVENWDRFFTSRMPTDGLNTMKSVFSALALYNAIANPSFSGGLQGLDIAQNAFGLGNDVLSVARVSQMVPCAFTTFVQRANIVGKFVDTGLAYHTMYTSAGSGTGAEFACDFVIYLGKGMMAAGAAISLTGAGAPLGATVSALGGGIWFLGEAFDLLRQMQSTLDSYNALIQRIEQLDDDGGRISRGPLDGEVFGRYRMIREMRYTEFRTSSYHSGSRLVLNDPAEQSHVSGLIDHFFNNVSFPSSPV